MKDIYEKIQNGHLYDDELLEAIRIYTDAISALEQINHPGYF